MHFCWYVTCCSATYTLDWIGLRPSAWRTRPIFNERFDERVCAGRMAPWRTDAGRLHKRGRNADGNDYGNAGKRKRDDMPTARFEHEAVRPVRPNV
jgi:hypothetical protein